MSYVQVPAVTFSCSEAFALNYTCDEFADMAAGFYELKKQGYQLEEVIAGIQKGSTGKPEKENLLRNLAIEVNLDPNVNSVEDSRKLAHSQCKH